MSKRPMKLLSLLLSVSLAMGMCSFPVLAQEAEVAAEETAEAEEIASPDAETQDTEDEQDASAEDLTAAEDAEEADADSVEETSEEEAVPAENAVEETGDQAENAEDAQKAEEPEAVEEAEEAETTDEEEASETAEEAGAEEAGTEEAAEDAEKAEDAQTAEEAAEQEPEADVPAETVEDVPAAEETVVTDPSAEDTATTAVSKEMTSVSIGGISYYYADTEGDADNTVYQAVVKSRAGSTTYDFTIGDLTQVSGTNYYYTVVTGVTPLSGTLYGYGEGTATNYKEVYGDLGVSTDSDSAYDAVTSATGFTGHHAKDIPSLVTFGEVGGEKAITGLTLGRSSSTVDAVTYVEASILKAAGEDLSDEQTAALTVTLKANPMSAPSADEISVGLSSASYASSRYGNAEFAIVPDDSVSGYVWSEYWNSIYAATVSNGETTVGAVHWIDLYGEAATNTASPHYNKVEIAINNGTSTGSNEAEVSRYADFYDTNTGNIKAGTYTIKLYAEGYSTLTAEVEVKAEAMSSVVIGGVTYYYADTTDDDAMTVYQLTVRSRAGSTTYNYMKSDLTQVTDSNVYYMAAPGATALTGTLYGYGEGTATNYKEVYGNLGVDTDSDSAYDAVTSATGFTGHHAKDIPSLVAYGTDAAGEKAITGLTLNRASATVDALTFVEASILQAAGSTLTDEQTAALKVTLKANPMSAPVEEKIDVALSSASFISSRYGKAEFAIVPDDSVSGYVWSEYWDGIYAATISNGETTVGAVHWIDMYGEAATNTASPHYNKVEIALNNGTSAGSNEAEVSRYAAFFDENTGNVKPGTYTITVYSEGYSDLTATVEVKAEALSTVTIGGVTYYYADTADDDAMTVYQATVRSRAGSTTYNYTKSDLTQVTGTDLYYTAAFGATPLTGTLYGYGEGTLSNYKEVYGKLGADTDTDSAYDAVTSATGYTGYHAKDIPSLVAYGTDAAGEKAITGLTLDRASATVDALTFVEASVLQAAGSTLTDEQTAALKVTLKANPMSAPAEEEINVALSSATLASSRYGKAEFAIVPDDSVSGYVWSEYWDGVYAATISNGETTVGAVHWIDMYGEAATNTASPHYNKVEIALNNGTSAGSNEAEVSRYAAFFDGDYIKPGTYTITIYAEGYSALTAEVEVGVELSDKSADYTGSEVTIDEAVLNGVTGEVAYTYYSDEACTEALDSAPVESGTYYVKAVAANAVVSNTAKLIIKKTSAITLKAKTATYTGKDINVAAATVTGSTGKVTYTYYTDAACTKEASSHKNAGTYYVKAAVEADADYSAAESSAVKLVINKAAQSFTVKASASSVDVGKTVKVTASGAKETKKYTFTSSNTKVATVNSAGTVTGKAAGTVTITVKTAATANYLAGTKTVKITVNKVLKKPGNCHFVKWNNAKYTSCKIAWNKVDGAEGYQTLLSWTNGSHASTTVVKSNVLYRNCTVHPQHVSQMKVRAFYTQNGVRKYGPWSNVEYITPSPTKLTAKNVSKGSNLKMKVSWNITYGCNGYNVFVTTNPKGTWYWNQSTSTKATATSATITKYRGSKLKKNTRYYVRIVTRRKRNGVFCTVPMPSASTYIGSFIIK